MRKLPFQRLVRDIASDFASSIRFQRSAILAYFLSFTCIVCRKLLKHIWLDYLKILIYVRFMPKE